MSALSQLHGGPTAEERYLAEMKRRELVDALGAWSLCVCAWCYCIAVMLVLRHRYVAMIH